MLIYEKAITQRLENVVFRNGAGFRLRAQDTAPVFQLHDKIHSSFRIPGYLIYAEDNLPQTKLQRELEGGMAISIGRLREDTQYDYKFVCLSHNTLRGAAGGGVLLAELLCAEGLID